MNKIYHLGGVLLLCTGLFLISSPFYAQDNDVSLLIGALLDDTPIEEDLQELCDGIGGRVTGSKANEMSVEWALKKFQKAGVPAVKHAFEMPALWLPEATTATIEGDIQFTPLIVSKYASPPGMYSGELLDGGLGTEADFKRLGDKATDQFVLVETDICLDINGLFKEYGDASMTEDLARKAGVKGIIFMSSRPKKVLYRFFTKRVFDNEIPQLVMAREDANRCIRALRKGNRLAINIQLKATTGEAYKSYNVIGEITGSERPEEVVVIGAHLDSWALGTGANDNGCNVTLMIDIARQMKQLNIQPKRTIRFALWNGEEQGYFGSYAYVKDHMDQMDQHVMAMSVDIGSGPIIGFFTNGREELGPLLDEMLRPVSAFGPFLNIPNAIVGTDNFDFLLEGVTNLVANQNPFNYGPNYHASSDTYDKVDFQSLKKNAAIVAAVTLAFANGPDEKVKFKRYSRSDIEEIMEKYHMEFAMRMFNVWEPWENKERGRKD